MIRSKKPFLLVVILCGCWIVTTYMLWMRQERNFDIGDTHSNEIDVKFNQLEKRIIKESAIHNQLVNKLLIAVKSRDKLAAAALQTATPLANVEYTTTQPIETDQVAINKAPIAVIDSNNIKEIQLLTTVEDAAWLAQNNLSAIRTSARSDDNFRGPVIPVLVFACNRISVRKCLDNLIEYRPNVHQFPIIVSQVCV